MTTAEDRRAFLRSLELTERLVAESGRQRSGRDPGRRERWRALEALGLDTPDEPCET